MKEVSTRVVEDTLNADRNTVAQICASLMGPLTLHAYTKH